jgi:inward rectifier potassium channel
MARSTRPRPFVDNLGRSSLSTIGLPSSFFRDLYHAILELRWRTLLCIAALAYSGTHLVFAALYVAQPGSLNNSDGSLLSAYFFSVQTMMTIGYGGMTPATTWANVVVTIEAFVGMIFTAMITGLMFAKFTRPNAAVLWSDVAVITRFEGKPTFMVRMANARRNRIVEASVSITTGLTTRTAEGETFRKIRDLALVRRSSPLFSVSWTAMHVIDESSPLHGQTQESLAESGLEIMVVLTGVDDTSAQSVHARKSYTAQDLRFGERFEDIFATTETGEQVIDYRRFQDTRPAPL